jgi:hypothetical protein
MAVPLFSNICMYLSWDAGAGNIDSDAAVASRLQTALDSGPEGERCEAYIPVQVSMTARISDGVISANVTLWFGENVRT